jgi:adenosylhomocysteine nucleosidase
MMGIMSAMPEEIDLLIAEMGGQAETISHGMRTYHRGFLWGAPVTLVFSRWGKVAAATTSTHLISALGVKEILFSGVAGAVDPQLRIGDVVIADHLYQHDMDARPLFQRYEIPLLDKSAFPADQRIREELSHAARLFLEVGFRSAVEASVRAKFEIVDPKVVTANMGSGDKFFAHRGEIEDLRSRFPIACVEMEGAAVAQVCYEHSIPLSVLRTISDRADSAAPIDFLEFTGRVAAIYSRGIIKNLITNRTGKIDGGGEIAGN